MFDELYEPVRKELLEVEKCIDLLSESNFPLLKEVGKHVFGKKGKQLRPIFLLHTYRLFKPDISDNAYRSAAMIEVLHSSSLVHDDVVDQADKRRGKPSVRSLWGNRAAVLSGDYLISNAFIRAFPEGSPMLVMYLLGVIRTMCEGELLQLQYTANPAITDDIYFNIIERKTASLFENCCRCGAYTAEASEDITLKLMEIGKAVGMAFQIKDDLLDITQISTHIEGKKYGNDLREGKITLPCLYFLSTISDSQKMEFFERIKIADTWSETELNEWIHRIINSGAEAYCNKHLKYYENKALLLYDNLSIGNNNPLFRELIKWICL